MAASYKVLGQVATVTGNANLYTCPGPATIVSSLTICNCNNVANSYRIMVRINAATAQQTQQYLAFDAALGANETVVLTLGLTLSTGDILTVSSNVAAVAFQAFGVESP